VPFHRPTSAAEGTAWLSTSSIRALDAATALTDRHDGSVSGSRPRPGDPKPSRPPATARRRRTRRHAAPRRQPVKGHRPRESHLPSRVPPSAGGPDAQVCWDPRPCPTPAGAGITPAAAPCWAARPGRPDPRRRLTGWPVRRSRPDAPQRAERGVGLWIGAGSYGFHARRARRRRPGGAAPDATIWCRCIWMAATTASTPWCRWPDLLSPKAAQPPGIAPETTLPRRTRRLRLAPRSAGSRPCTTRARSLLPSVRRRGPVDFQSAAYWRCGIVGQSFETTGWLGRTLDAVGWPLPRDQRVWTRPGARTWRVMTATVYDPSSFNFHRGVWAALPDAYRDASSRVLRRPGGRAATYQTPGAGPARPLRVDDSTCRRAAPYPDSDLGTTSEPGLARRGGTRRRSVGGRFDTPTTSPPARRAAEGPGLGRLDGGPRAVAPRADLVWRIRPRPRTTSPHDHWPGAWDGGRRPGERGIAASSRPGPPG
jgi:hypothetical protein